VPGPSPERDCGWLHLKCAYDSVKDHLGGAVDEVGDAAGTVGGFAKGAVTGDSGLLLLAAATIWVPGLDVVTSEMAGAALVDAAITGLAEGGTEIIAAEAETAALDAAADEASTELARGGVYSLRDEAGNIVRTGRSNDLAAREIAHANDAVLGDFQFNVEYRTDVYGEQRGLEQFLYNQNPGAQAANGGFNKIRGISPTNPNLGSYMQSAWDFLSRLGGG
jgi:hypothetical protein